MGRGRKNTSKMLVCTACPKGSDAEQLHPELQVPICGACVAALRDADQNLIDNQLQYCTWCGEADDVNLMFCDTCTRAFCYDCIARNFGKADADFVQALEIWSCYVCFVTPRLKQLQVSENIEYYNIERAYAAVHPPSMSELRQQSVAIQLTPEEQKLAAIFTNSINNVSIHDSELIAKYLTAADLSVILRVSRGLRKLFQSEVFVVPGLFKTEYGIENQCRLYDHQVVSLTRMTQIENANTEFGALRGGIFGDEPGLGKTVTTLALVATTAGVLPRQPAAFWDRTTIEEHWLAKRGQFGSFLGPMLNTLQKCPEMGRFTSPGIHHLRSNIETYCTSIETFEAKVRSILKEEVRRPQDCAKMRDIFRLEMNKIREGLDPNNRKIATSSTPAQQRMRLERSLCPSSATLIVVPLALLEHWYEQITRHLQLDYFTQDEDHRGVVYLDGLGDIVDVEAPLSKLKVDTGTPMVPAQFLSHYLIVVTTFERCAAEVKQRGDVSSNGTTGAGSVPLLQLRWLRLVVDEGHEIGKSDSDPFAMRVTKFISQIAAERRWVMSGTPTTGANSKLALAQLYRIFQFLRHPRIAAGPSRKSASVEKLLQDGSSGGLGVMVKHEPDEFIGAQAWERAVVNPCLAQDKEAWMEVMQLLRNVLLRHTKADIHLFEPIRSNVNLELEGGPGALRNVSPEERMAIIDSAKAQYIAQTMIAARREWRQFYRQSGFNNSEARRRSILSRLHVRVRDEEDEVEGGAGASGEVDVGHSFAIGSDAGSPVKIKAEPGVASSPTSSSSPRFPKTTRNMLALSNEEQQVLIKSRCPKAIVFSQHNWDLEGVTHHLILRMGPSAICEHTGVYRSSELSRFRHSKRKYRRCPMCGYCNQSTTGSCCLNALLLVEYHDVPVPPEGTTTPQPGGHGRNNPGGHYTGRCLCSPEGCPQPEGWRGSNTRGTVFCKGLPNPFFELVNELQAPQPYNPNLAIVSVEHIDGYIPGVNFAVGQPVVVRKQDPCLHVENTPLEPAEVADQDREALGLPPSTIMGPTRAALWRGGVLGGHAIVRGWRKCGGKGPHNNWHGSKVLENVPWTVESEEASILMLKEDGSTGLDLSFATHIFLLDPIKDPALRNQIISRAHRMGATGPVQVQLVQVSVDDD